MPRPAPAQPGISSHQHTHLASVPIHPFVCVQVDREMVLFFSVINEASTLFAKQNASNDSGFPAPVYRHAINGGGSSTFHISRAFGMGMAAVPRYWQPPRRGCHVTSGVLP